MSPLKKIITSLVLIAMVFSVSPAMALTFTEVVNLLQAPDINLPTGVTNPKGNIGFILSNLFWGTADGTKNGKIKPQYLDYSGISSWTQSGTITYLTASTGSVGIGTPNPGEYSTAIRGIDDTATVGALWVSGQTATTPGLMVRNDGNVGIGTASPQAPLQVNGPATSGVQYAMNVIGGAATAWTDGAAIKIGPSTTGQYGSRIVSYSNAPASYGSRLQLQTHDTSATNQSFNTGLLIDENGNIGIGTTVPTSKLRIYNTNAYVWGGTPNSLCLTIDSQDNGGPTANADMYYNNLSIRNLYAGSVPTADNYKPAKIHFLTVTTDGYAAGAYIGITNVWQAYGKGDLIFGAGLQSDSTIPERMRINSAGNVGIGTASPSSTIGSNRVLEIAGSYGGLALSSTVPSANKVEISNFGYNSMVFATNSLERMRINSVGNVGIGITDPWSYRLYINGTWYLGAAAWAYSSDRRLKENIIPLKYGIKEIMKLDAKKFDYIKGEKNNLGFIAQDMQSILPELVTTQPNGMLWLKTDMIIPVLVNAMKEQQRQIEKLTDEVRELKKR